MYTEKTKEKGAFTKNEVLNDFRLACESRQASLLGRKEVFKGKAKFGIFGDGKELAQIAMSKHFAKGDIRAGYYRDQTFMFAIGQLSIQQYFAQLYAHTDVEAEPASGGRSMNGHFGTRMLDEKGKWKNLTDEKHSSSDISPTGGHMPRLLGLAFASKKYREIKGLHSHTQFSNNGNEIAWGTIGNASTSEGLFYEAMNAAGVLQVPMLMSVWDDGFGISVSKEYHTTKQSISKALAGLQRNKKEKGFEIITAKGWDYTELCKTYEKASKICREEHVPILVHIEEMTQPQGHSTSGSHERYKSKERLQWEKDFDCIAKFGEWIVDNSLATKEELQTIEEKAVQDVRDAQKAAWNAFVADMKSDYDEALSLLAAASEKSSKRDEISAIRTKLATTIDPMRGDAIDAVKKTLRSLRFENDAVKEPLRSFLKRTASENRDRYSSHLYSQSDEAALNVKEIKPVYSPDKKQVDGREVLQAFFDLAIERDARVFAFGEDVGRIGDVNQGFAGLQEKHGIERVFDTGIREATIIGQGIGAAMRGLRPIAEIQYLDYIFYAVETLADDLASLQYRTKGGQKAPLIVRTRGHRLEGIWHSGSPMGMLINSLRGMLLLVPRDMTRAAGFYNTLLKSDEPALVVECLNGYRLKETTPDNLADFTVPVGVPETLREGDDITIVTYGSMCRIVMAAAEELEAMGIDCEVIDVQSLLPFDIHHNILESVKKTNRVLFADEDVNGGATAFMMQQVVDGQGAWRWLDSKPACISAHDHRPAYSSDGDYFSKPNTEDIIFKVYSILHEASPAKYPELL